MLALFSLLAGAALALVLRPSVSPDQSRYLAMAVVAAIDSSFGGLRAHLEQTFSDRLFVLAFVSNAAVAVLHLPPEVHLPPTQGASNRMRVINSGGGSTAAARSMNATAAAESRASSAQAGHSRRWLSTSVCRIASIVPST